MGVAGTPTRQVLVRDGPGNTDYKGEFSTADLRIRVACFVLKRNYFTEYKPDKINQLVQGVQDCSPPSPSVSVTWMDKLLEREREKERERERKRELEEVVRHLY